ncbi:MAG TPA: hypothetical protein QGH09_05185 [Vicinamibacterales bacterium]|nr:hypothetical protein [Vicinamibacterales bacterium]
MAVRHIALPSNGTAISKLSMEVFHYVEFEQRGKLASFQGLLISVLHQ